MKLCGGVTSGLLSCRGGLCNFTALVRYNVAFYRLSRYVAGEPVIIS